MGNKVQQPCSRLAHRLHLTQKPPLAWILSQVGRKALPLAVDACPALTCPSSSNKLPSAAASQAWRTCSHSCLRHCSSNASVSSASWCTLHRAALCGLCQVLCLLLGSCFTLGGDWTSLFTYHICLEIAHGVLGRPAQSQTHSKCTTSRRVFPEKVAC